MMSRSWAVPSLILRMGKLAASRAFWAMTAGSSRPIEESCADDEEIRDCIAETVIHEFGHYFGMSEEQIEEIEEKFWRGESIEQA